jgi:hypothetical protein
VVLTVVCQALQQGAIGTVVEDVQDLIDCGAAAVRVTTAVLVFIHILPTVAGIA